MAPLILNLGPRWKREREIIIIIIIIIILFFVINVLTLQPWTNFEDNTVNIRLNTYYNKLQAHSVALRPKAWVCGLWLPGIAGSNSAGCTDVCLLGMLCGFR